MKKLIAIMAVVVMALGVSVANAADDSKIAVVNVGKILHSSAKVKKATDQLKSEFSSRQKKIKAMQGDLQTELDKMKKDASVMSTSDRKKLEDKITTDRQNLIQQISAFQKDLNAAQQKAMKQVFDQLNGVISSVAKKGGYNMVLDKQFVIYSTSTYDITDEVQTAFSKS
ncbi:MAG: OmpH family outer membrane protein [Gammaproteobacteria bacterium]